MQKYKWNVGGTSESWEGSVACAAALAAASVGTLMAAVTATPAPSPSQHIAQFFMTTARLRVPVCSGEAQHGEAFQTLFAG